MKTLFYFLVLLACVHSHGQNALEFLNSAKHHASDKNLDESLEVVRQGLERFPKDHDLLAYKVRLHLWNSAYSLADESLAMLFDMYPHDYEGYELHVLRYYWSEDWSELEKVAEQALNVYPEDLSFQEKKLLSLIKQGKYELATVYHDGLDQQSKSMSALLEQMKLFHHQQIGFSGTYSQFDEVLTPWSIGRLEYRRISKNSWNVSATYAHMFDEDGVGFNGEYYPYLGKNLRGFFDLGLSDATILPNYQLGGEITYALGAFEISTGSRLLKFEESDDPINIFTLSGGHYFSQYYANLKTYISVIDGSSELTHALLLRRFFRNRFHYLQVNATTGAVPLQISNFNEVVRLNAQSVLVTYSHLLNHTFVIQGAIGGQQEQFVSGGKRNRITGRIGVSKIF